jgi:hypothetical protein
MTTPMTSGSVRSAAFYCVADRRHFLGAVALLNSLRLVGHQEPLFLLDCGLDSRQRMLLDGHATVLTPRRTLHPMLQKPEAPLRHPTEIMALLDSDVIVTRSLSPLLEQAAGGQVVAFANDKPRFFLEWAGLAGGIIPRQQPYVASGHLFLPRIVGERLLLLVKEGQDRIDLRRTLLGDGTPGDPFYYPDMDVLNAILATRFRRRDLAIVDQRLAPFAPFTGVHIVDEDTLACRNPDGSRPFVLHHTLRKPWLGATRMTAYARLLTRLLLSYDVPLRLEPEMVPLRLRSGPLARIDGVRAHAQASIRPFVRGRLGIRRRLASARRKGDVAQRETVAAR